MIANERKSTTVEITIGYLTKSQIERLTSIYNSRNYYRLLNTLTGVIFTRSTTVEITIGYLTNASIVLSIQIYNSRNYYRLLNYIEHTL